MVKFVDYYFGGEEEGPLNKLVMVTLNKIGTDLGSGD